MDAASLFFGHKLLDIIHEKRAEMTKVLLQGQGVVDYPDYRHRAGYLSGLADVEKWMAAITLEDEKREMRP